MSQPAKAGSPGTLSVIHGRIAQLQNSPTEVDAKSRRIYETVLRESRRMDGGNFRVIETDDLIRIYRLYDAEYFEGACETLIRDVHRTALTFRLSPRMTSAGGKTTRTKRFEPTPTGRITTIDYEIAISTLLLFQTFLDPSQPALVCGLTCRDRLDALLRIFEHELIHLLEMLVWGESSCSASNFQSLAYRIFGHQGVVHELITPQVRAAKEFTLKVGDHVRFEHEGKTYRGILNRITRRASVLVPGVGGIVYSDGHSYLKYYVPLESLVKDE